MLYTMNTTTLATIMNLCACAVLSMFIISLDAADIPKTANTSLLRNAIFRPTVTYEQPSINTDNDGPCMNDDDCSADEVCFTPIGTCESCLAWSNADGIPQKCQDYLSENTPSVVETETTYDEPCISESNCKLGYWCYKHTGTCESCETLRDHPDDQKIYCAAWIEAKQSDKDEMKVKLTIYLIVGALIIIIVIIVLVLIACCICQKKKPVIRQPEQNNAEEASFPLNGSRYSHRSLSNIYHAAARKCLTKHKVKTKNPKHKNKKNNPKWYTCELTKLKKEVHKMSIKLSSNPYNKQLRTECYNMKRKYKQLVKKKRREYKNDILTKLDTMSNSRLVEYWNLINELKGGQENKLCDNINAEKWYEHFKILNTDEIPFDDNLKIETDSTVTLLVE
ncbi:uncharacterized protein LOC102808034 [Saccoglossus kowalevskii]|uniref:Uncharacterized protein LOC102808034 n=1 Tax=Saccoglossus kowalevskii TaxID=10224 RepID=A0ABM0LWD0_SACKO|nr:PREDICTED: uncharacterized protein LOC102808034 [Saccoglossus kowalevskii]